MSRFNTSTSLPIFVSFLISLAIIFSSSSVSVSSSYTCKNNDVHTLIFTIDDFAISHVFPPRFDAYSNMLAIAFVIAMIAYVFEKGRSLQEDVDSIA